MQFYNACQASRDRGPFSREGLSSPALSDGESLHLRTACACGCFFIAQVLGIPSSWSFMSGKCLTCAFRLGGVETQRAGHQPAVLKGEVGRRIGRGERLESRDAGAFTRASPRTGQAAPVSVANC